MQYDKIKVISTHDGDTTTLEIDLFIGRQYFRGPCRLLGINAPELSQEGGNDAKLYLAGLLGTRKVLKAYIKTDDKYGRPLADIYVRGPKVEGLYTWIGVSEKMIEKGYATRISLEQQINQDKNIHLFVTSACYKTKPISYSYKSL